MIIALEEMLKLSLQVLVTDRLLSMIPAFKKGKVKKEFMSLMLIFFFSLVQEWKEHTRTIIKLHRSKYNPTQVTFFFHFHKLSEKAKPFYFQVVSGSSSGEVKIWDVRNSSSSIKTLSLYAVKDKMKALASHDNIPLLVRYFYFYIQEKIVNCSHLKHLFLKVWLSGRRLKCLIYPGMKSLVYQQNGWIQFKVWTRSHFTLRN